MTEPNIPIVPGNPPAADPAPTPVQPYGYPQYTPSPYGIHVANIILSILTCGAWLPFYLLIAMVMPAKRVRVMAPFGTPPHLIDEARRQALQLTPAEQARVKSRNQGLAAAAITVGCIVAFFVVLAVLSQD